MRKIEKKELYRKLTIFLGHKIQILNLEGWQDKEIYEKTGIPQNRLTEIKRFEKYQRPINEKTLAIFLEKGFVKVKDILDKVDLNSDEKEEVQGLKYFETSEFRKEAIKMDNMAKELGTNGLDAIRKANKALSLELEKKNKKA